VKESSKSIDRKYKHPRTIIDDCCAPSELFLFYVRLLSCKNEKVLSALADCGFEWDAKDLNQIIARPVARPKKEEVLSVARSGIVLSDDEDWGTSQNIRTKDVEEGSSESATPPPEKSAQWGDDLVIRLNVWRDDHAAAARTSASARRLSQLREAALNGASPQPPPALYVLDFQRLKGQQIEFLHLSATIIALLKTKR